MSRKLYRINKETLELEEIYNSEKEYSPAIHPDEIPPTEHPATGEIFTSRKKFDEATFRAGCVPIAGCDKPTKRRSIDFEAKRNHLSDLLEKTYYDLRENRIPRGEHTDATDRAWRTIIDGDYKP
jgi:hypothetical protein